jgi:hypothetical protein
MKQFIGLFLIAITLILTSCEIKEEITFNEDGSGEIYLGYNMSKLMEEFPAQKNKSTTIKAIDSIIDFNTILNDPKYKDSIAKASEKDKKNLELLKNLKIRIIADEANKKMEFGFNFAFKNIDSIQDIFKKIKDAQEITKINKKAEMAKGKLTYNSLTGENQKVIYKYDNHTFTRTTLLKQKLSTKDKKEIDKALKNEDNPFDKILNNLKYTIVLHFPKKIKKVNVKNAVFSDHKKTVTVTYRLEDFMLHPEKMNLKVKLAKK